MYKQTKPQVDRLEQMKEKISQERRLMSIEQNNNKPRTKLDILVIENSTADTFVEASKEWIAIAPYYGMSKTCRCGQKHLKERNIIYNNTTGRFLFPIGSSCVDYFKNYEMTKSMYMHRYIEKILTNLPVVGVRGILLEKPYFSAKFIYYLYEEGVFNHTTNENSRYTAEFDCRLMLDMFQPHKRNNMTKNQKWNVYERIIPNKVIPYILAKGKEISATQDKLKKLDEVTLIQAKIDAGTKRIDEIRNTLANYILSDLEYDKLKTEMISTENNVLAFRTKLEEIYSVK